MSFKSGFESRERERERERVAYTSVPPIRGSLARRPAAEHSRFLDNDADWCTVADFPPIYFVTAGDMRLSPYS